LDITKQIILEHIANINLLSPDLQQLLQHAQEATQQAYAPYSKFYVGAAALLSNGQILTGSNQENAAFPSGLCAERVLLNTLAHSHAAHKIVALAITARTDDYLIPELLSPCGGCLQVLAQTVTRQQADFPIYTFSENKPIYKAAGVSSFLPFGFELK
jgi:cytidine deaminase